MQAEALDEERLAAPSRPTTVSLTWFPADVYERARQRWPDLRDEWDGVPHADYCAELQRHLLRFKREGLAVRAVAPIALDDYVSFCQERELDPQEPASRAGYATELTALGRTIPWPPSRNAPCWCGSDNKYKRCCGAVETGPPHPG